MDELTNEYGLLPSWRFDGDQCVVMVLKTAEAVKVLPKSPETSLKHVSSRVRFELIDEDKAAAMDELVLQQRLS